MLESIANLASTNASQYVTVLLDHFQHQGPNGNHLCLVFEPMGPSANSMVEELPCFKRRTMNMDIRYPLWMAKRLLQQVLQGLAYLHGNGIVHGDFQPGNMLFALKDMSNVDENELAQDDQFQSQEVNRDEEYNDIELSEDGEYPVRSVSPVERLDGKIDNWAPRYLTIAQPLDKYANIDPDFTVKMSDLGRGKHTPFLVVFDGSPLSP